MGKKLNIFIVFFLLVSLVLVSKNVVFADTACGAGAYCTGNNRYLKVDHCVASSNGQYCLNSGLSSVTMSCPVGGGGGSCVGPAPGKDGCQNIFPTGGSSGTCNCSAGGATCTGNGTACTNQSSPYNSGTCGCFGGTPGGCADPDQGTTLGCCLAGPYCGDGSCNNGETCSSCPGDCGACGGATNTPIPPTPIPSGSCGNGQVDAGETCSNCPQDVGVCQSGGSCGDGHVNAGETCANCQVDVGACPNPTPTGTTCTPVCSGELCGQQNGCGGFCSDRDNKAAPAPTQNSPANGATVTAYDTTILGVAYKAVDITLTTQSDINYNAYYTYIDIYPVGTSCANALAKCRSQVSAGAGKNQQLTYTYLIPAAQYGNVASFQWRVYHSNATCSKVDGTFSPFETFIITDTVSGSVVRDDGVAGLSGGVCTSPFSPVPYTPSGTETITVTYNGVNYTTNLNPDGTWSIQAPISNSGQNSVVFASNSGLPDACGCPAGCSYTGINSPTNGLTVYFQPVDIRDNWWQTIGGSVFGGQTTGTAVESLVPIDTCASPNCNPYMTLKNDDGDANTSGVAFTGGGSIDTTNTAGYQADHIDQDGRNIQSTDAGIDTLVENYTYFYRLYSMGINPTSDLTATPNKPTTAPANARGYYRNGDMTINSNWTLSNTDSMVIFVNGNLTINKNITVPTGGFLAFIVSGNITVGSSVCQADPASTVAQVQGVFVADGSFIVQSTGTGDCKFVADGIFTAWNGFQLNRDFRNGGANDVLNATHPAEVFRYRPDFLVNIPARMTRPLYQWQEIAP